MSLGARFPLIFQQFFVMKLFFQKSNKLFIYFFKLYIYITLKKNKNIIYDLRLVPFGAFRTEVVTTSLNNSL